MGDEWLISMLFGISDTINSKGPCSQSLARSQLKRQTEVTMIALMKLNRVSLNFSSIV